MRDRLKRWLIDGACLLVMLIVLCAFVLSLLRQCGPRVSRTELAMDTRLVWSGYW